MIWLTYLQRPRQMCGFVRLLAIDEHIRLIAFYVTFGRVQVEHILIAQPRILGDVAKTMTKKLSISTYCDFVRVDDESMPFFHVCDSLSTVADARIFLHVKELRVESR